MTWTNRDVPPPGSLEARSRGCLCLGGKPRTWVLRVENAEYQEKVCPVHAGVPPHKERRVGNRPTVIVPYGKHVYSEREQKIRAVLGSLVDEDPRLLEELAGTIEECAAEGCRNDGRSVR